MNPHKPLPLALLVSLIFAPALARASTSEAGQKALADAFVLFSKGAYSQAIDKAEQIKATDAETRASIYFFEGNAQSKMQAFDKAVVNFRKAIQAGSLEPSVHYDLGQALFASQELKAAEAEFRISIVRKFKMGASAYYIAYIRSVLDDKPGARDFYGRISKLSHDPDKVKQSSLLQIAELSFEDATEMKADPKKKAARKRMLEGETLALYRRARDYDPATPVADQARARIGEIEGQLEEMVERMRNGNPLPRQPWALLLSQDLTYDTNVITQADQASIQVSNADALISKTGFIAKYQFSLAKTFSIIPELGSSITYHSRRSTPNVYQNDNVSISPALRTKYEHWSGGKPATLQLDLDFNLLLRDYQKAHQLPFYTRYYQTSLSERVKWFSTGNTTFKAAIKFMEYYDPSKNYYAPTLSITQLISVGSQSLVNTLSYDYQHTRDDFNDERNYRFRTSMNFSQVIEKIDVTAAIGMYVKDTMKQKGTRGNETNLAPNVALTRPFSKHIDGMLEYTWTKNFSLSKDVYEYTKGEVHFGMSYNF
jgi:tetratricopeptide (TPR) repeat protein